MREVPCASMLITSSSEWGQMMGDPQKQTLAPVDAAEDHVKLDPPGSEQAFSVNPHHFRISMGEIHQMATTLR